LTDDRTDYDNYAPFNNRRRELEKELYDMGSLQIVAFERNLE
jgi:hypothetical protein